MTIARMMRRLVAAAAATVLLASAAHAFSREAVEDAQTLLKTIQQRMQAGDATPTDVALAEHYLAEMKYRAGQIRLTDYCRTARPSLEAVINGVSEEFRGARRTTREVIDAKRTWFQFRATCGG